MLRVLLLNDDGCCGMKATSLKSLVHPIEVVYGEHMWCGGIMSHLSWNEHPVFFDLLYDGNCLAGQLSLKCIIADLLA